MTISDEEAITILAMPEGGYVVRAPYDSPGQRLREIAAFSGPDDLIAWLTTATQNGAGFRVIER